LKVRSTINDQWTDTMARDEKTSKAIASIASRALKDPKSVTQAEIKKLAATALTQAADKPKTPAKKTPAKKAPAKKAAAKKPAARKPVAKKAAAKKATKRR
jgi:hypothetical protein